MLPDADPLLDVRNSTAINTIILNGEVYGRDGLDALREGVAEFLGSSN